MYAFKDAFISLLFLGNKMNNTLQIHGSRSSIINPKTGYDLDLKASYQGVTYDLSKITGAAMVFHFSREDSLFTPDGLNIILLMTTGNGHYRATGLKKYDRGDGKPQFYLIGDDLEIKVESSADQAIKEFTRRIKKEIGF